MGTGLICPICLKGVKRILYFNFRPIYKKKFTARSQFTKTFDYSHQDKTTVIFLSHYEASIDNMSQTQWTSELQ